MQIIHDQESQELILDYKGFKVPFFDSNEISKYENPKFKIFRDKVKNKFYFKKEPIQDDRPAAVLEIDTEELLKIAMTFYLTENKICYVKRSPEN